MTKEQAEKEVGEMFGFFPKHGTWYFSEPPHVALSVAPESNLTTGDKLCLAMSLAVRLKLENEELREKIMEQAGRLATLFWHDCLTVGERGANHCQFEGTHICTACRLADTESKLAELKERVETCFR